MSDAWKTASGLLTTLLDKLGYIKLLGLLVVIGMTWAFAVEPAVFMPAIEALLGNPLISGMLIAFGVLAIIVVWWENRLQTIEADCKATRIHLTNRYECERRIRAAFQSRLLAELMSNHTQVWSVDDAMHEISRIRDEAEASFVPRNYERRPYDLETDGPRAC